VSRKTFFTTIFPILMTALMIFTIKSITTDANKESSEKAIDMLSDPIAFLASGVYDLFSVYFPEYGDRERKHKVVKAYQEGEIKNITQPLQILKDSNDTAGYNALRATYVKHLFEIAKFSNGKILEVKAYLSSGIDINTQDEKGRTILYYATGMKNSYLVRYLLKEGADTEIRDYIDLRAVDLLDKDKDAQLYLAFHHGDVVADANVKGLTNVSANYSYDANGKIIKTQVYGEQPSSWTPLMNAIQNNQTSEAKQYINSDQYLHAQTNNGSTALFFAIKFKNREVIDALLAHGADIQHRNHFGMNPLALAIKLNNLYAVRQLVEKGVDIHSVCASERTPVKFAQINKKEVIERYLVSVGAS